MLVARIARFIRASGFGIFSVAIHLALVVLCVLFATPATDSFAADKDLIDVEIQPALGQPHGKDEGKGLGSHVPKPPPPLPEPEPFEAPPPRPPPDPEAIPTTTEPEEPLPDAGAADYADASDEAAVAQNTGDGGEYDPTTPIGTENVPPAFGSPDGVEGGQGTKKKMSPQYQGILHSWAHARVLAGGHGLGSAPEGTRPCATVRLQFAGFQVTGASFTPSGSGPFDQKIQSGLGNVSGASVPPGPDGETPTPTVAFRFCQD